MRACETCVWWVRLPENFSGKLVATLKIARESELLENVADHGQCRRMPPRISERTVPTGKRQTMVVTLTEFPDTPRTAWCGEWAVASAAERMPAGGGEA